jgi:hypothetical protein
MNLRCIIVAVLLAFTAQENIAQKTGNDIHFNFGAKAGVQAITYNDPEFDIEGYEFDRSNIQSNKIGFTFAPFIRLSKGKFYLQTEATMGIARHSFEFKDISTAEIENTAAGIAEYELKTYCIQVPILFGYSIVQQGKFGMSIFTGPRTKFTFTALSEQNFKHFKHKGLEEVLKDKTYYWEIGLGVNIHNVFFDFAYDVGITKASEHIISDKEGVRFRSDRRDNILSFSIGMIF